MALINPDQLRRSPGSKSLIATGKRHFTRPRGRFKINF